MVGCAAMVRMKTRRSSTQQPLKMIAQLCKRKDTVRRTPMLMVVRVREAQWSARYERLGRWLLETGRFPRQKYTSTNGRRLSPAEKEELELALFVTRQRTYGEAQLSHINATLDGHSRAELLERLDGWTWHSHTHKWESMYTQTEEWVRIQKKLPRNIQKASMTPAEQYEKKLAIWLNAQRIPGNRQRLENTSANVRGARDTRGGHIRSLLALCDASFG